ncbi:helix-turn-helix domain-containing protein [Stenotrophomonas maltophilia]|uniref:helix-turn-helix domain-containing protein n=1 Tax=Stenotrophomonas maltophilia TaxID=40324 RepID=UPI003B5E0AE4
MHNRRMNPTTAIAQLIESGMTEKVIAAAINVNQATVNRIRRGVTAPTYETGKALVDMALAIDWPSLKAARRRVTNPADKETVGGSGSAVQQPPTSGEAA